MNRRAPRPPKLESWVEETERKVRLIIDHHPRCKNPTCHRVLTGYAARPWQHTCMCGFYNEERESAVS